MSNFTRLESCGKGVANGLSSSTRAMTSFKHLTYANATTLETVDVGENFPRNQLRDILYKMYMNRFCNLTGASKSVELQQNTLSYMAVSHIISSQHDAQNFDYQFLSLPVVFEDYQLVQQKQLCTRIIHSVILPVTKGVSSYN